MLAVYTTVLVPALIFPHPATSSLGTEILLEHPQSVSFLWKISQVFTHT